MCGSMADIQSATTENRRGKKERKKEEDSTASKYNDLAYWAAMKTEMLRRDGPVIKSVESVLRPEGSLWWERFMKEVSFEPGVKERGSYGW